MSEIDAERLQNDIDANIMKASIIDLRIVLDSGSDVTDLRQLVDVRVFTPDRDKYRDFTIVTIYGLASLLSSTDRENAALPYSTGNYSTGGPLCVVREITGESVVCAVRRFLYLEAAKTGSSTLGEQAGVRRPV